MKELRVMHVAPHLAQGGAERILHLLATRPTPGVCHSLMLMGDEVFFDSSEIEVSTLGFDFSRRARSMANLAPAILTLRKHVEATSPDLVVGWLYYGAFLTTTLARSVPTVWSIHNTTMPPFLANPTLHVVDRILARRSARKPRNVIYCANSARREHERRGYASNRNVVVANGVDINRFCPDPRQRQKARHTLGLRSDEIAVTLCCRYDPQKNITVALDVFARFCQTATNAILLLVGRGMTAENAELAALVGERRLERRCRYVGPLADTMPLMRASDVVLLASGFGEAMPIVLLEALASGTPIAATRIGDVEELCVPNEALADPGDTEGLLAALRFAAAGAHDERWQDAFERVRRDFTLEQCITGYDAVFRASVRALGVED